MIALKGAGHALVAKKKKKRVLENTIDKMNASPPHACFFPTSHLSKIYLSMVMHTVTAVCRRTKLEGYCKLKANVSGSKKKLNKCNLGPLGKDPQT